MDASVREKGRHVGSFRLQEQKESCIWISKKCMAVETAANAFMVFVWTFVVCIKHYRRYFLEASRPSCCKLYEAGYQNVRRF